VTGEHYAGGHWLGSFATYLTTRRGMWQGAAESSSTSRRAPMATSRAPTAGSTARRRDSAHRAAAQNRPA